MLKRLLTIGLVMGLVMGLVIGLAVMATPAEGSGCRAVHRCATPVVVEKVAVVEAVAVLPIVSAFVQPQVIAYGAAYAGPPFGGQYWNTADYPKGGQPSFPQQPGRQDPVLAALQRLEQRLGVIEQRSGIAPPQAQTAPMPAADAPPAQAPQQQEPLPANNGGLAPLSAEKQKKLLERVYTEDAKIRMPKGKPALTDEELGLVVQWIASPGPPAPEVVKLFSTKCALCHQSGREGSGGGFVLTLK